MLNHRIACALLFIGSAVTPAQTPVSGAPVPSLDGFDTVMLQLISTWNSPGAALAITVDGRLVFAHGYGYADSAAMEPVQPDSLFRIASITKPFTAAAILKLIEQGKLQLSTTPFTTILQDLTPPLGQTEDPRIAQITIQQLLNHSAGWDDSIAGVPDPPFAFVDTAAETFATTPPATPDILIRYMLGQPLQHDPGTVTAYSNFGYIVLGLVIERVSGQTYADYVKSAIQTPASIVRMQLAGSLLANRAPNEVRYYDYPGAPLVGSVFPPLGTSVPAPYGGFSLELMEANGGWMASTMDLLRYADTMNGQLTPPILQSPPSGFVGYVPPVGNNWGWNFYGSLPGTNTLIHLDTGYQVNGRVTWAALFNTRSGSDTSQPETDADAKILQAIQGIAAWPSNDLFPTYSGTKSSCAFSLSGQSQNVPAAGGPVQVSVQDQNNCAWTAVSPASWVTVTAGGVNSDSGAASLAIAANSGIARKAVLSIAGQSFTINQSGVAPTVSATPASSSITTSDALNVAIAVGAGTGNPTPTGSITLMSGTYASAITPLSGGTATIAVPAGALAVGTDTLAASYSGDNNYSPSTGSASITVTAPVASGFKVAGTPLTIASGATTGNTSTVTVTPDGGFTGTVTLSAAVTASPMGAQNIPTLSFGAANSVTITSASSATATLTVSTTAPTTSLLHIPKRWGGGGAVVAFTLLLGSLRRRRSVLTVTRSMTLFGLLCGNLAACGSGTKATGNPGTTPGAYTVTVTATSGSMSATSDFNLTIH